MCDNIEQPKKRGRKPGKKKKGYFYEEEEAAFVEYIKSDNQTYRDKIFQEKLFPAFTKMIESIIRRYDLFTPSEDFTDTFYDTLSFLITKVNNYDLKKGKKVYSYCGTICKNYLILKRSQIMKQQSKNIAYDNVFNENTQEQPMYYEGDNNIQFHNTLIENTIKNIEDILSNNSKLSVNEQKVGMALIEMLTNWEEIFRRLETKKFNKSSVLFFIKQTTNLNTKDIREAMYKFKDVYYNTKEILISE